MESIKCTGKECKHKSSCVRFIMKSESYSIQIEPPIDWSEGCSNYWNSAQETIINLK